MFKQVVAFGSMLFLIGNLYSPGYAKILHDPFINEKFPTPVMTATPSPVVSQSYNPPAVSKSVEEAREKSASSFTPSPVVLPQAASQALLATQSLEQKVSQFAPWSVRGVNYFDPHNTWERMWENFDYAQVGKDLDLAKSINSNTFRIFVQHATFGGASLDPKMVSRLRYFLDSAHARDMKVIVTLFDGEKDFCVLENEYVAAHAAQIAASLNDHPAILLYDLKNEPNCNGRLTDGLLVKLRSVSDALRAVSSMPQTVGLLEADVDRIGEVGEFTDVLQIHHYWTENTLDSLLARASAQSRGKPLILGEFGKPVRYLKNNVLQILTEEDQAAYFSSALSTSRRHNLAGVLLWTLYDFDDKNPQAAPGNVDQFGIYDKNGKARLAVEIVRQAYGSR